MSEKKSKHKKNKTSHNSSKHSAHKQKKGKSKTTIVPRDFCSITESLDDQETSDFIEFLKQTRSGTANGSSLERILDKFILPRNSGKKLKKTYCLIEIDHTGTYDSTSVGININRIEMQ